MKFSRVVLAFLSLGLLLVGVDAHALSKEEAKAEHVRLSEEMNRLARRSAWRGVDRSYRSMEPLLRKGVQLSFQDHYLGAQAARELGNVTLVYRRLLSAKATDARPEAVNWLDDILARYGEVELILPERFKRTISLTVAVMPLQPDQRSTIGRAQARVSEGGSYEGLLPAGEYTIDEQKFTVVPGGSTIRIEISKKKKGASQVTKREAGSKEPFRLTYFGPRADVGFAWTQAGEVSDGGVTPGGFGGAGAHLGAGVEFGLSGNWFTAVEFGYQGLAGAPADDTGQLEELSRFNLRKDGLNLGYGWLAAGLIMNPVRFMVGPIYAIGKDSVTGVSQACIDKPGSGSCGDLETTSSQTLRYSRLDGSVKAAGGAFGASYGLWSFGRLTSAVTVQFGALNDSSRWYPWGTVALSVVPLGPEDNS